MKPHCSTKTNFERFLLDISNYFGKLNTLWQNFMLKKCTERTHFMKTMPKFAWIWPTNLIDDCPFCKTLCETPRLKKNMTQHFDEHSFCDQATSVEMIAPILRILTDPKFECLFLFKWPTHFIRRSPFYITLLCEQPTELYDPHNLILFCINIQPYA